jgi:hypothetical protein
MRLARRVDDLTSADRDLDAAQIHVLCWSGSSRNRVVRIILDLGRRSFSSRLFAVFVSLSVVLNPCRSPCKDKAS